jgi:hypothetical protein
MAKINTMNYHPVTAWNGTQDLFVVEQPDGTKVATPEQVKQYMEAGDFEATGEVKDGHGNILKDMANAVSDITDGMDIIIATVTWPSSGTYIQRVTNVITQIISGMSFTKPFNVVDIKDNNNVFRAQILYQAVSGGSGGSYGIGLYFSYYQDYIYKFVNVNGTITVKQLSEV